MAENERRPALDTPTSRDDHPDRRLECTTHPAAVARTEVERLRDTQRRADSLAAVLAHWALLDTDMLGFAALAERIFADVSRTLIELESVAA
jgi:hypothetical protein